MEWHIEYLVQDRIVRITTSGMMSLAELMSMAKEGLAEVERRDSGLVLIDHRRTTPALKVSEIYRLPDNLLAIGLPRDLKVATVYSQDSSRKRDFEFYGDVCFNLGLKQVLFIDLDAALRWLLEDAPQSV